MNSSISRRLVMWLSIPLALLVLLGAIGDYYLNAAEELARGEQRLTHALDFLVARIQANDISLNAPATPPIQTPWLAANSISYAVRNAQQQLIAGDEHLPIIHPSLPTQRMRSAMIVAHQNLNLITQQLEVPGGPFTVTVAEAVDTLWSMVRLGFMGKLLWEFILLDVTLILAWIGVKVGLRPLRELREQIAARSPQDLHPIPESSAPQEIAPLIATLNRLFAVVRNSIESQQQLIANTAHQLRTPITGINAQLELLVVDPTAAAIKDRLLALHESVGQLARSTNQLLTLARTDAATKLVIQNKPVNLQLFISELTARFVDRAIAAEIDLGVDLEPVWVSADVSLLDDLLSNLIDNALKYSPAGGVITVSARIEDGRPFLEVDDNGSGIPESEYQRVRQRYYRSPSASGYGSGLGLAIVDEITRLYRGALLIKPGYSGQGTRVRVVFPTEMHIGYR